MAKIADVNEVLAWAVVNVYKKMEKSVVCGYKKIETGIVGGFNRVSDKCVDILFTKKGETVEEAKKRLAGNEV